MARSRRVVVMQESPTGRNLHFKDTKTKEEMTRHQFTCRIEKGEYPDYHVRKVHGVKTPVSNPDCKTRNNLG